VVIAEQDARYQTLNQLTNTYSTQKIVCLDPNEIYIFTLNNNQSRTIKLISVKTHKDSVVEAVRWADAAVEIDGKKVNLICGPYVMPTEIYGVRIQADTTDDWVKLPKKVQFSIWDAKDPIVNTEKFSFPLKDYGLFTHSIQAYDEVVHLGGKDGDPNGHIFYHNYGLDMAGFEGKQRILACTDGEVSMFWSPDNRICSVVVRDEAGLFWEYCHCDSVDPNIKVGAKVKKGQPIGYLGKTGPSGNFAHLHLGLYLSQADLDADKRVETLNLYPWVVYAYQQQYKQNLYAVAKPNQIAFTGETIYFDASKSLAFNSKIVSYKWIFPDGSIAAGEKTQKTFTDPGVYAVTLHIKDNKGNEDVDFCNVKVFAKSAPKNPMPTIFASCIPSLGVRQKQNVTFRFWLPADQGNQKLLKIDFGDGAIIDDYKPYSEVTHKFTKPGIYIVTAQIRLDGKNIVQKQKVVVAP